MKPLLTCMAMAFAAFAQSSAIDTPRESQRASVSQRIELTDITIHYHRPLAKGRKIWGEMVPYGKVWRAGANENTTIEFSDPVSVEGQRLAKGVYGLHMIPTEDAWTIVFSKNSTAWGSFTYDDKEDALRITVKPRVEAFSTDALTYSFDSVEPGATTIAMRWDKLAVSFKVAADREATVSRLRDQLRGRAYFSWDGNNDAAQWCLDHNVNLEESLKWTDQSIQMEERFENVMLKAQTLAALHRDSEAAPVKAHALELANAPQLYAYGRQLTIEKHKAEAVAVFRLVAKRFPEHWLGIVAQARVAYADGDVDRAKKALDRAEAAAPEPSKPSIKMLKGRISSGEEVNG